MTKHIAILGGTSGIGRALAVQAAALGHRVTVGARRAPEELSELRTYDVHYHRVEVTDLQSLAEFFADVGTVHHFVCTPGPAVGGSFIGTDLNAARSMFDTKFWGQVCAAQIALRDRSLESLLFVSGIAGTMPSAGLGLLCALNAGIEALTRTLAIEAAPVRVNCVSPGLVDTPAHAEMPPEARAQMMASSAEASLLKKVATADEVADAAVFALTNPHVTGEVIHIDGGQRWGR